MSLSVGTPPQSHSEEAMKGGYMETCKESDFENVAPRCRICGYPQKSSDEDVSMKRLPSLPKSGTIADVRSEVQKRELIRLRKAIREAREIHDNNLAILYGGYHLCSCPSCEILEKALGEGQ